MWLLIFNWSLIVFSKKKGEEKISTNYQLFKSLPLLNYIKLHTTCKVKSPKSLPFWSGNKSAGSLIKTFRIFPIWLAKSYRLLVSGIPRESGRGRDLGCGSGIGTG